MAYTNEEKRSWSISYIIEYLNTLDTLEKFKTFVGGVTPDKLKAKLKKAYQDAQLEGDVVVGSAQEKIANDAEMEAEIDTW